MGYFLHITRLALRPGFSPVLPFFAGILLCLLFFSSCQPSQQDQLFDAYFEPYKDILSKRGAIDNASPVLLDAMTAYNEKAYDEAITLFQQAQEFDPENPAIPFYLGVSYLAINKPKTAISHFTPVSNQQDLIFGAHTAWYLALASLKAGQLDQAIEQMENINRSDSRYSQPCAQILAALPGTHSLMGETAASN